VVEIIENRPVTIECVSHSEPPALYNIQYNGRQLNQNNNIGSFKIDEMKIKDEGDYFCVASNPKLANKETRKLKLLVASKSLFQLKWIEIQILFSMLNPNFRYFQHLIMCC